MILTNYLRYQVLKPFLVISAGLITLFSGYMIARYLAQAAEGEIPVSVIGRLIFFRVLIAQEVLLPTTFYFSIILALGRLYRDAEIVAMFAAGFSLSRIYRAILTLAVAVSLVVAIFSLKVRPWAWQEFFNLKAKAKASFDLKRLKAGVFYELPEKKLFFAQELRPHERLARKVFLYEKDKALIRVVRAQTACQKGSGAQLFLLLQKGRVYEFRPGQKMIMVSQFEELKLPLLLPEASPPQKVKAEPTKALFQNLNTENLAELEWRFAAPLSTFLLAFLGLVLSHTRPREGRFKRFPWAILLFAAYFYSSAGLKKAVAQGAFPPLPGLYLTHLGLLVVALFLGYRMTRQ